jgi:hypothetical protein
VQVELGTLFPREGLALGEQQTKAVIAMRKMPVVGVSRLWRSGQTSKDLPRQGPGSRSRSPHEGDGRSVPPRDGGDNEFRESVSHTAGIPETGLQ